MIDNLKALGANIRSSRSELDISLSELAFKLGIDKAYMSRIERGEINIGIMLFLKICGALNTSPNELLS